MMDKISRYLDHAVLNPEMTEQEAIDAIKLGIENNVRTVCVRPCDIELAIKLCSGSATEVCCVIGFPHGTVPSEIKASEAALYIKLGAREVDMVVNYGYICSGKWELVENDIRAVSEVTRQAGVTLKVIFETSMLTLEEVDRATRVAIKAKADFVKTSTGFNGGGASEEAVEVMLRAAEGKIKVKASGGIRDYQRAKMFVDMGCHRLGVGYNSTPVICQGNKVSDFNRNDY